MAIVKDEFGGKPRVVVAVSEFGKFHDHRFARKAMHHSVSWPKHYEELKRSAKEAFKKDVNVTVVSDDEDEKQPEETEDILSKIAKLSKEELSRVKEKLSELEKEEVPASEE